MKVIQSAQPPNTPTATPPLYELEGGSIPVVHDFQSKLSKPIILLGFGLPEDNIQAPNKRFALRRYEKGIEIGVRMLLAQRLHVLISHHFGLLISWHKRF